MIAIGMMDNALISSRKVESKVRRGTPFAATMKSKKATRPQPAAGLWLCTPKMRKPTGACKKSSGFIQRLPFSTLSRSPRFREEEEGEYGGAEEEEEVLPMFSCGSRS